ncbi:MAG: tyrosine recombinase XerC [Desulfovibrio sp.]|jgi:integrase/recombinase XerC|nr:tyrosine recombinase XerC [Desulfovibrio sp.]
MSISPADVSPGRQERPEILHEEMEKFFVWLAVQKNCSVATQNAYRSDLEQFLAFLVEKRQRPDAYFRNIGRKDIQAFLAELFRLNGAKSSMARKLAAIRSFFKFLQHSGALKENVARQVRNPRQDRRHPRALNVDETFALLNVHAPRDAPDGKAERLRSRDLALAELLYGSGLRISEALALNLEDFPGSGNVLRIKGKGGRERLAPLSDASLAALSAWLEVRGHFADVRQQAFFVGARGGRLQRREASRIIGGLCRRAGLTFTISPHSLRHSFATHLLIAGADLRSVQELLGHKRLTTTQRYTQVSLEHLVTVYDKAHPRSGLQSDGSK